MNMIACRRIFCAVLVSLANPVCAQSLPLGQIDRIVRENSQWIIYGWACQPGLGSKIDLNVFIGGVRYGFGAWSTNFPAEAGVHAICGTSPLSGANYRFEIPYQGPIFGQVVRIFGIGTGLAQDINGSNVYGFPENDPEGVIASANRILLLVAHEDDELVFAPMLGRYCNFKLCRVVVATTNRTYHPDPNEFVNSMSSYPAVYDRGTFSSLLASSRTPTQVLSA